MCVWGGGGGEVGDGEKGFTHPKFYFSVNSTRRKTYRDHHLLGLRNGINFLWTWLTYLYSIHDKT